ncbi:hypothetical protein D8674_004122 [Pyrus ussuriensis x Pyrus communis]|uniref:Uncharacterized protein n=1 Tax=Pyrus ussuriensis x Pyrus communis TaxID=2448454 RepID=A0A5N5FJJ8_9ROSA|nr:hypothetical protein D8674_004122 [Pyrus ussuriensis x Pyrus communis]
MADFGGPSLKRVQGEGFEKDKKQKRVATCVQYTSSAKIGYQKSDIVNKFRGDVGVLPDWDIDKSDANLMKCIDVVFKYCFWELKFDAERDAERHEVFELADD